MKAASCYFNGKFLSHFRECFKLFLFPHFLSDSVAELKPTAQSTGSDLWL